MSLAYMFTVLLILSYSDFKIVCYVILPASTYM
jgi:hypothetical protein